jgi:hypothetical protein|tara:strand:+ start:5850 stop:6047 length:198 start_codon:yes stop_codon:yes gene_type:complete
VGADVRPLHVEPEVAEEGSEPRSKLGFREQALLDSRLDRDNRTDEAERKQTRDRDIGARNQRHRA